MSTGASFLPSHRASYTVSPCTRTQREHVPKSVYVAPPETEVGFVTSKGESRSLTFTAHGNYSTDDADEIAALEALAELETHPVGWKGNQKDAPAAAPDPNVKEN